jgi:TPR repeat protein
MVNSNKQHYMSACGVDTAGGDAIALNAAADRHFYGDGCRRDYRAAVALYRQAAEMGYDVAQYNLAYCYEEGHGVIKSGRKAFHWYKQSAGQGNAKAQNNLGNCYAWGYGVTKDLKEAFACYRKSAVQGYHWGEYNLAECYEEGLGVKKDRAEAVRWYTLSSEHGNEDAAKAMRPDTRRRRKFLKYSKHLLYVAGTVLFIAFMVTNYYETKAYETYLDGVEAYGRKDYDRAVSLFTEAMELGSAEAVNHLGVCYERGHGVEKNDALAYRYFIESAEDGCGMAMHNLGRFYENGKFVPKDVGKAVLWYREAAEKGDENSKKALKRLGRK